MHGIVNDPNASCDFSVEETIEWCKAVMASSGMTKIIVSKEWARRLELEGFDMSLVEISRPFGASNEMKIHKTEAKNYNGPRNRWGGLK